MNSSATLLIFSWPNSLLIPLLKENKKILKIFLSKYSKVSLINEKIECWSVKSQLTKPI